METKSTEGLFTQFSKTLDEIMHVYTELPDRQRKLLRKKGFERRHINSMMKVKQAMIDANFLVTGNVYTEREENQMELPF